MFLFIKPCQLEGYYVILELAIYSVWQFGLVRVEDYAFWLFFKVGGDGDGTYC